MKVKTVKICRDCGDEFKPFKTTDCRCVDCIIKKAVKDNQAKREKEYEKVLKPIRKKNLATKEALKTYSKWMQELQVIFNRFIRLRDASQPCISCGTTKDVKYDAGHFYSVGAYPNLRIHEHNVHKQCSKNCNFEKHGNHAEYSIRLPERIGVDAFIELQSIRHNTPLKLSVPEIKDLKSHYRKLIKNLES